MVNYQLSEDEAFLVFFVESGTEPEEEVDDVDGTQDDKPEPQNDIDFLVEHIDHLKMVI